MTKICMKIAFWKVIPGNTRKEARKVNKEGRKVDEVHGWSGCSLVAPGGSPEIPGGKCPVEHLPTDPSPTG